MSWNVRSVSALALSLLAAGCAGGPGDDAPKLVLLISVDTLRSDRLGAYGSDRELSPNLDRLAQESLVFEAAYAPSSFTVPSISSILTGRYPEQNAINRNESILPSGVPTLAEAFARRGYRTGAVVSNFVLRRGTGLDRGFEHYDDRQPQSEIARGIPERVANHTTDDALRLLGQLSADDERVFLWVHYQDPHGPYTPPPGMIQKYLPAERERPGSTRRLPFGKDHRGLDGIPTYQRIGQEDEVAFYLAAYDAEIRFTDSEIGRLLEGVRQAGLWNEALIVFVADHGEGLGEKDYWFAHGEYLSDPLVRVPFFLRVPGGPHGRRSEVVGIFDLTTTLLARIGAPSPGRLPGRDLLAAGAESSPSTVYMATLRGSSRPRFGIVADGYKYVETIAGDGTPRNVELYKLGEEDRDLSTSEPQVTERLSHRLREIKEGIGTERRERRQNRSAEDLEMLRKLGYLGPEEG